MGAWTSCSWELDEAGAGREEGADGRQAENDKHAEIGVVGKKRGVD